MYPPIVTLSQTMGPAAEPERNGMEKSTPVLFAPLGSYKWPFVRLQLAVEHEVDAAHFYIRNEVKLSKGL